jgi:DNA-binding transcriptional regulator YdaS (Cro superfamily)
MNTINPIKRACDEVGGRNALARLIGVSPSYVSQLIAGDRPIPVERCPEIERATSGAVTRRDLRPDDWHLIWPELVTAEHPAPASEAA